MAATRRLLMVMSVGFAIVCGSRPVAAFGVLPPDGLRGIKAFAIDVTLLSWPFGAGAETSIEAAVAERLAAAQITVLSDNDCVANDDCGGLDIHVQILASKSGALVAYVVEAAVLQEVKLVRDPSIDLHMVATYHDLEIGLAASDRALEAVSATAADLGRRFSIGWRKENR